jgi:hypothetical protein
MEPLAVTLGQVRAFRLHRQHLTERAPAGAMLAAVHAVHGIQAQVAAHAQFALGQRVEGCVPARINAALWEERSLVKTWAMRGTVHWLPADEEPLYVSGLSSLRAAYALRYLERNGIAREQVQELQERVLEALDGQRLTRREAAAVVLPHVGAWAEPLLTSSWGGVMRMLCMQGLALFGPPDGSRIPFVRRDQWLPAAPAIDPHEARCELLRRYLRTFGPATSADFAYWLGLPNRDLASVWSCLRPELAEVSVVGERRWLLVEDREALAGAALPPGQVRLLPAFDPLLLAHRTKSDHLDLRFHKRVYGAAAWVYPVVMVDGVIRGTWSYARTAKRLTVTLKPFDRFNQKLERAATRETQRLGTMLGLAGDVALATE